MAQSDITHSACLEASALIRAEQPNLDIIFIPCSYMQEDQAFEKAQDRIRNSGCARAFMDAFQMHKKPFMPYETVILGPFKTRQKASLLGKADSVYSACVFVPMQLFHHANRTLQHLLAKAYPAILEVLSPLTHKGLCMGMRSDNRVLLAQNNMCADWFGSFSEALLKRRMQSQDIAILRCGQVLSMNTRHYPEYYPTPIAFDSAMLIQKSLDKKSLQRNKIALAVEMTEEIRDTIPRRFIEKWMVFSERAQRLAWGGVPKTDILGMAVHTTEDVDVRAIASIVAETIKTPPRLATFFDTYNPFTPSAVNARHHEQKCKVFFKKILTRLKKGKSFDFKAAFQEHNLRFIKHDPLGWSALGIHELTQTLHLLQNEAADKSQDEMLEILSASFERACASISWDDIERAFNIIHEKKREGFSFTGDSLLEALQEAELPNFERFKTVFSPYKDRIIYDAEKEKLQEIEETIGDLELDEAG